MTTLHPQLKKDCVIVGRFELCLLLLMRDANYPWFILVPDRDNVREIYQLSEVDQMQLLRESSLLGSILMNVFGGDKLNIAALGNVVPQLHVHHIVRFTNDAAWPAPVWNKVPAMPYDDELLRDRLLKVKDALANVSTFVDSRF